MLTGVPFTTLRPGGLFALTVAWLWSVTETLTVARFSDGTCLPLETEYVRTTSIGAFEPTTAFLSSAEGEKRIR